MCAVSPNTHIAVAGYRAVVEYLFWFFLVTRLIENDRDFAVFYGCLLYTSSLRKIFWQMSSASWVDFK